MLESTDWQGGLRDRVLVASGEQRQCVEPAVEAVVKAIRANIFPIHNI